MIRKIVTTFSVLVLLAVLGTIIVNFYPFIFARHVKGVIIGVSKVNPQATVIGNGKTLSDEQMFSFAVAIKDSKDGEIVTGSSEDRQWAVAREGLCAEAKFFPYPPWQLSNADTYFNVRLIKLYDCVTSASPGVTAGPGVTASPADSSAHSSPPPGALPLVAPTPKEKAKRPPGAL